MAKKKRPCFLLERDQKEIIDELDNEEAGIIFKAIYEYETSGQEIKLDKSLRIVFKQFKVKLDFYDKEYEIKCEKNKKNIEDYWNKVKNTNEYDGIQSNTMATNKEKENKNKIKKEKEKKVCVINTHIPDTHDTVFQYCVSIYENYDEKDLKKSCKRFFNNYESTDWKIGNKEIKNWKAKLEQWIDKDIEENKIKEKEEEYTDEAGFEYKNGRRIL